MSETEKTENLLTMVKKSNHYEKLVREIFLQGDIEINGNRDWDIRVTNQKFFKRVLGDGTLGLGEAYMEGWWDCENIPKMIGKLARAKIQKKVNINLKNIFYYSMAKFLNPVNKIRAFEVGKRHYDLGNDLFHFMLDKRMIYSCGYWKNAENLDQAQENKLDLICKKVMLHSGMRVLDIGCGWGGFAKYAAEKYGVEVLGISVSQEQIRMAKENCSGLPVEFRYMDYRELKGSFDRIVSIGMFEHVCHQNYRKFMNIVFRCLKEDGLFLLQTIGGNELINRQQAPWTWKYIFPNSEIPSAKYIGKAIEGLFVLEDWCNFGSDYAKTLLAWHQNFVENWRKIREKYDETFYRMWSFYLLLSQGLFQSRYLQLWQILSSKTGIPEGFQKNINYNFKNV